MTKVNKYVYEENMKNSKAIGRQKVVREENACLWLITFSLPLILPDITFEHSLINCYFELDG